MAHRPGYVVGSMATQTISIDEANPQLVAIVLTQTDTQTDRHREIETDRELFNVGHIQLDISSKCRLLRSLLGTNILLDV